MNRDEALQELIQKRLKEFMPEHQEAVFADIDKMVAHMARTHRLHQDEIALLMASWFNSQPCCIKIDIIEKREK
jgi:hypothetical protein